MPCRLPGHNQLVHPYYVVLIVPSMRMLLNDSPRRTPGQLGWVRPGPQCSWIHRRSRALLACQKKSPEVPAETPEGLQRAPEGRGAERGSQQAQGQGADCLCRKQAQRSTPCRGTAVPPVLVKSPPVTQPASAAALTCEGQVHSPSGLHRAWVRTSPCLFHLVSLDAVVLFAAHRQGLHGPSGPSGPFGPSGPYGPDGTFALQHLHSSGPAWSTDFGCISGDAEWKTAHLLVPLASQLLHLFLFLTHGDPLVFLALPEQASLSLLILWTSGQFDSRVWPCSAVLCCVPYCEAISLVARPIFSEYTRAHTHI